MSVLQRFTNVARGWVRARLHPDPDEAAARAALDAELAGPTPRRIRPALTPGDHVPDLDPETTTDPGTPLAGRRLPEVPGPPETDADGNPRRTL